MLFWNFCIALIALFFFFFLVGFACFRNACHRRKSYPADRKEHGGGTSIPEEGRSALTESRLWFDAQPFEEVSVRSCDGLRLAGQLLLADGLPKGLILFFHGYHSSCRRDLSLQAYRLHKEGYHLLLISQRAHGESEGNYICFGAKERLDVLPWCRFAANRFGELPIALFGLSMGATTVLMSAGVGLPPQVRCIIGDCGFTSPWEIIRNTLPHKHKIPPYPVIYFMNYWSRLLAHFDYRECSTTDALKDSALPTLLFHGSEDTYVPTEMSRRVSAINPTRIELVIVPKARHAQSIYFDPDGYVAKVTEFLEKNLSTPTKS